MKKNSNFVIPFNAHFDGKKKMNEKHFKHKILTEFLKEKKNLKINF